MSIKMQAVVLCAGKGERMGVKFRDSQKCAVMINGEPLIVQGVKNLISAGIKEVFLLTGHKAEQIEQCFSGAFYEEHVKLIFCGDPYEIPLNTLSTILRAERFINGPFLCVHGDILLSSSIVVQLTKSFEVYHSAMTITVSHKKQIAPTHARVEYDDDLIVKDVKMPEFSNQDIWVGMDLYQPCVIDMCKNKRLASQKDLAEAILATRQEIRVVQYRQDFIHITTPADIL